MAVNSLIVLHLHRRVRHGVLHLGPAAKQGGCPLSADLLLCVYPWFTDNFYVLCGVGLVLVALPFFVDF